MDIQSLATECRAAGILLAGVSSEVKNNALLKIIATLKEEKSAIIAANQKDMMEAESNNIEAPLLKRLKFDENKIHEACEGIRSLIQLDDPENGEIIGKGFFEIFWQGGSLYTGVDIKVYETIKLQVKEGKYRIIFIDFRIKYYVSSSVDMTIEDWSLIRRNRAVGFLPKVDKRVNSLVQSINKSMQTKVVEDNW